MFWTCEKLGGLYVTWEGIKPKFSWGLTCHELNDGTELNVVHYEFCSRDRGSVDSWSSRSKIPMRLTWPFGQPRTTSNCFPSFDALLSSDWAPGPPSWPPLLLPLQAPQQSGPFCVLLGGAEEKSEEVLGPAGSVCTWTAVFYGHQSNWYS